MISIDRRRFLQLGAGAGVGLGTHGTVVAHGRAGARRAESDLDRVRLTGDGLSLNPAECARLWTRLVQDNAIASDSYSNGGVVEELEAQFARVLGKERTVFMPTGTLANHLAVRALAGGPSRAIVSAESHLYNDTGDCVQTLSDVQLIPVAPGRASFTLDEVKAVLSRTSSGRVATPMSVIVIESPVRRKTGEVFDEAEMDRITTFARQEGIRLHLDGARIFLQAAYTGRDVAEYARPFDTVYVSLYKYFNAGSGAILAGPRVLLDEMYHVRRMFGGGLAKVWPFASIALHYVPGFIDRFRQAIAVSEEWMKRVERHDAFRVDRIPSGTNLFGLRVSHPDLETFRNRLHARGIILSVPQSDGSGFRLNVNEMWNRTTAADLADAFVQSLDG